MLSERKYTKRKKSGGLNTNKHNSLGTNLILFLSRRNFKKVYSRSSSVKQVFCSSCNISHFKIRRAEDLEDKVYEDHSKRKILAVKKRRVDVILILLVSSWK